MLDLRNDFPLLRNNPDLIYFDSAATSLKPQCVIDAVDEFYTSYSSNIHRGDYDISLKASKAYDNTRKLVKEFINARDESEIVFTPGDTYGLNQIVSGYVKTHIKDDEVILTTLLEHASSILPVFESCEKFEYLKLNEDGSINIDYVKDIFNTSNIKYVVITYVSNVLGYINPIKEICSIAHEYGAKVIVDAAQAAPHFKIDVQDLDVDFLTFSGHKMLGPSGIGVLYGKKELLEEMTPLCFGGGANARFDKEGHIILKNVPERFEAGTPNYVAAYALKVALDYVSHLGMDNIAAWEHELGEYARQRLSAIPHMRIFGQATRRESVVSFLVGDIHHLDMGTLLDRLGIAVRTGHHCAQPVMTRLGIEGTVRASFSFYNTKAEVDALCDGIEQVARMF